MKYNLTYTHLDLFSGIGGFSLGLESTGKFKTVAFCEFDKAAQKVLKLRWPNVPIFEDIRGINEETLEGTKVPATPIAKMRDGERDTGEVAEGQSEKEKLWAKPCDSRANEADGVFGIDIITGGFPCQPFSVAGKRSGTEDNRYLWPELLRVISLVKPTWCILENVRGLLSIEDGLVFENCLLDLEAAGYEHQTLVIPACAVNAQHRRDRVWIVAKSGGERCHNRSDNRQERLVLHNINGYAKESKPERKGWIGRTRETGQDVADTTSIGRQGQRESVQRSNKKKEGERQTDNVESISEPRIRRTESRLGGEFDGISRWLDESGLPKVSSGVSKRADRLKQLGNSIVPQIAAAIGYAILEI